MQAKSIQKLWKSRSKFSRTKLKAWKKALNKPKIKQRLLKLKLQLFKPKKRKCELRAALLRLSCAESVIKRKSR